MVVLLLAGLVAAATTGVTPSPTPTSAPAEHFVPLREVVYNVSYVVVTKGADVSYGGVSSAAGFADDH